MPSSKYDRRITIQASKNIEDEFGGLVTDWIKQCMVWANIFYGTGSELRAAAAQEQAVATATVTVRFSQVMQALTPQKNRLLFDNKEWDIVGSVPGRGRNREIVITCKARLS